MISGIFSPRNPDHSITAWPRQPAGHVVVF